jgi:carboxypeptidase family protein
VRAALSLTAAILCLATCRRFPIGSIEGTVRDRSGTPLANVSVGVEGLAPSGVSDASGRYRLSPSVPVGTHRVRAGLAGYASQVRDSVVVRKGVTTQVDFRLDRQWSKFMNPQRAD